MDNMHNAELYGRVLRCNYAQPMKIKGGEVGWSTQPVWADADEYQERLQEERDT
jgi:peptidyl-prolyl isomerase E (cyclophilin E)